MGAESSGCEIHCFCRRGFLGHLLQREPLTFPRARRRDAERGPSPQCILCSLSRDQLFPLRPWSELLTLLQVLLLPSSRTICPPERPEPKGLGCLGQLGV